MRVRPTMVSTSPRGPPAAATRATCETQVSRRLIPHGWLSLPDRTRRQPFADLRREQPMVVEKVDHQLNEGLTAQRMRCCENGPPELVRRLGQVAHRSGRHKVHVTL